MGTRLLRRDPAVRDAGRLLQLPNGRARPRPRHVRTQLRPTRPYQGPLRPRQRLPHQPEHQASPVEPHTRPPNEEAATLRPSFDGHSAEVTFANTGHALLTC